MDNLKLNIKDLAKIKSDKIPLEEKLEIIKCSRTYITSLPYDLRATSWDKLSERFKACKEERLKREDMITTLDKYLGMNITEANEIVDEMENVSNIFLDMKHKQQAFEEADKKALKEKQETMENYSFSVEEDLYLLPQELTDRFLELNKKYDWDNRSTSWLNESEAKEYKDLAKDIRDAVVRYDDYLWNETNASIEAILSYEEGRLRDSRDFADMLDRVASNDNYIPNLPQLYSEYKESSIKYKNANSIKDLEKKYRSSMDTIERLRNDLDRNIMEATDLHDEALRTGKRMSELGLLDDVDHRRIIDEYRHGE